MCSKEACPLVADQMKGFANKWLTDITAVKVNAP